ncbi:MAG: methylmalonyl-CoA epimerase [Alphaproteobacteria bacterium TMED87]|nr:methylmalonyl-CoA epimerase [Rhodospirillaceae bacterium]OUV09594.1 MAG: methylmalonyl-CoA epimerase [Alphaproteobacteria bacterium TMED87]|tara:strand:+ start:115 stop:519 length:405 start_codon:yes stop_codon:yes gene_type:complete
MIGKLNHIAIVVPDLTLAANTYKSVFGANVSDPVSLPEHGVTTVFVNLPNTKIELLHPLGDGSPIKKFLDRNASGGIHHICYEVQNIIKSRDKLLGDGYRILGDHEPSVGAHGKPVIFLHPKDFFGTLIELEEI